MDHVELTLNGVVWKMPINYAVLLKVSELVGDPLQIAMDAEAQLAKWKAEDIINVLCVGVSAAGCSMPREAVADCLVKHGILKYIETAAEYVVALVSGGEEIADSSGKA